MKGSTIRALHLFKRICGEDNYKDVFLAITFCNKIESCIQDGIQREGRLQKIEDFESL